MPNYEAVEWALPCLSSSYVTILVLFVVCFLGKMDNFNNEIVKKEINCQI